jgi:hypothetical protein
VEDKHMIDTDDADLKPSTQDTTRPPTGPQGPAQLALKHQDETPPEMPAPFLILTGFLKHNAPANVRAAIYHMVSDAVRQGQLPGLVHRSEQATMQVMAARGSGEVERKYRTVLLWMTADLGERINQLARQAVQDEVVRTGGKGFTVAELIDMGKDFDAGAMAASAKKRREQDRKRKQSTRKAKTKTDRA